MSLHSKLPQRLGALRAHLRTPLYRNAYAWLISTGLTSALGIVYWVLAARYYTPLQVGLGAALISTMILVAGVAQLNLASALVRFLPTAGAMAARLTAGAYGVAVLLALAASVIVIQIDARVAAVDLFGADWRLAAMFVPATMAWTVFNLQDSALTGVRAAVWVPVDNAVYGVAKIVLLIGLAQVAPAWGIFLSWTVPAAVLLLPFNGLLFGRLIPQHVQRTRSAVQRLRQGQLTKFIASNYLGALFALVSGRLLPVLVVAVAGAAAAAYFYLAWTIANSLRLVTIQMATSLTVEGALDRAGATLNGAKFLRLLGGLLVPLVLLLVAAAPLILQLSGPEYAARGVPLLRLLSLSIVPGLVVSCYLSLARIQQHNLQVIVVEGALAALSLGLSYWLLRWQGVTGVGTALLVSTTLIALVLLPRFWPAAWPWRAQPEAGLD